MWRSARRFEGREGVEQNPGLAGRAGARWVDTRGLRWRRCRGGRALDQRAVAHAGQGAEDLLSSETLALANDLIHASNVDLVLARVHEMGGHLRVDYAEGQYAEFSVALPAARG